MPISFNTFSQIAQAAPKDSQTIAKSGDQLQKGSAFGFFKFGAKKAENLATSKAFVDSIKSDPVLKHYLPAVADVTRDLETSTKPLTARTIKAVEASLSQAVTAQRTKNADTARDLRNDLGLNQTVLKVIRDYCDKNGIDMAGMDPKKAFELAKGPITDKFLETMPNANQEVKTGLRQAPFIMNAVKEMIPSDCHRLDKLPANILTGLGQKLEPHIAFMGHMGTACYSLNSEDVQKAVAFLMENGDRGLVPNAQIPITLAVMTSEITDGKGDLNSAEGCGKALISAMARTPAVNVMENVLTENGVPPETAKALSTPLANHPKVVPALTEALEGLDFNSESLLDDMRTSIGRVMQSFMAENKAELQYIVGQFEEMGMPLKTQKAIINGVLGGSDFCGMVLVSDGVMKPEAFVKSLEDFDQCLNSCTHGKAGSFGKDDRTAVIAKVMDYYLRQSGVSKSDAYQSLHAQFAPTARNLSLLATSATNFNFDYSLQLKATSQWTILGSMAEGLQPYAKGSDESETVVLFDGKTQAQITEDFAGEKHITDARGLPATVPLVEAGNKQLEPLTIAVGKAFGLDPALFGIQSSHDVKAMHAVADPLLGLINHAVSSAPNAQLTAMINGLKADCDLSDRDGLSVDVSKINTKFLREAVYKAYTDLVQASGDMVTEESFAKVAKDTIARELTKMGDAMDTIAQSTTIAAQDKQTMLDMVLATTVRTAPALDAVYKASFTCLPAQMNPLADTIANTAQHSIALVDTLPNLILTAFGVAAKSLHTASAGATVGDMAPAGDMAIDKLAEGLAYTLVNTNRLSPGQRAHLSRELNAEHTQNLGELFSGMNNGIGKMLDNIQTYPQGTEVRLRTKQATNNATLAGLTALRDQLDARLAKDAGTAVPTTKPLFYYRPAPEIPCHLFSKEVLERCTSGLFKEAKELVSTMDTLLAGEIPKPHPATFDVANRVMNRLKNAPYNANVVEQLVVRHADKLKDAMGIDNKELSPRQIYSILTGKRAPLRLKEADLAAKIHDVTVESYRKMGAQLSPATTQNEAFLVSFVSAALSQGVSAKDMASVMKGNRLTLDSVGEKPLTLSGLAKYNEGNAFGLVTDFRRKDANSSVSFTNNHGNVTRFTAHPEITPDENVATNPIFQDIMNTAGAMTHTPMQKAIVLQAISQASTVIFKMFGSAFAQGISEHGNFSFDFTQKGDGSVDARITMAPQNGFDGSLTLNITANGFTRPTSFDFGLARRVGR